MAEQLHALQQLLRGGLGNAGRIFDPVLTIEGILRLVADKSPLIGGLIQFACPELVGNFLGNLYVFVVGVPRIKRAAGSDTPGRLCLLRDNFVPKQPKQNAPAYRKGTQAQEITYSLKS